MSKNKPYNKESQFNAFVDLSEDEFEDLCRDLFSKSNEVVHARKLFGKGYSQFGGDVLVQAEGTDSYLVQSKHYPKTNFSRTDIENAVKLFTDHWDSHWKKHKVKRFYLVVSRSVTTDDQLSAIQEQRELLLNDYGITFIYWDKKDLEEELKPHHDLVRQYFDEYWWNRLSPAGNNDAAKGFVTDKFAEKILTRNFEQMVGLLSENILDKIEPIRHLARCGNQKEAVEEFLSLKEKYFEHIGDKERAELLSLEIRLRFPHDINSTEARRLLDKIQQEYPDFQILYLDALLTSYEESFEAAIEKLSVCPDTPTFNLKLSFLLNTENYSEAISLYESGEQSLIRDTETKRLHALSLLAGGETEKAKTVVEEAFAEQPLWEGVRIARGIIYYYYGQASQTLLENPLAFPQPRPWHLIKTDYESREKRAEASRIFKDILSCEKFSKEDTQLFESWYLACLADDSDRRDEAVEYARHILEQDSTNIYVLIWALGRNMPVDFSKSKEELEKAFATSGKKEGKDYINRALILLPLYLKDDQITKAKCHLNNIKSLLGKIKEEDLFAYWNCQLALVKGETNLIEKKLALKIENIELRQSIQISALLADYQISPNRANRRKYGKRLAKILRKSQDPQYIWLYCQYCHSQKKWNEVIKFGDSLINKIPNGESLSIVCDAYYQSKKPEKCLELLKKYRYFFPKNELPSSLSRIEAYAWLHAGSPVKAAEVSKQLFKKEKSTANFLTFVDAHNLAGEWPAIKGAVEQMPSLDELTVHQQLHISELVLSVDRNLAVELWRKVKSRSLESGEIINPVFLLGNRLGEETGDLMQLMMDGTKGGKNNNRLLKVSEWQEMMQDRTAHLHDVEKLYFEGQIPTQLYCEEYNRTLTTAYHLLPKLNAENEVFRNKHKILIRHGNRIIENAEFLKAKPEWNIHIDISTLLLLKHLDLLKAVENFAPIYITREIIPLLKIEIDQIEERIPISRINTGKVILKSLRNGISRKLDPEQKGGEEEKSKAASSSEELGEFYSRLLQQSVSEEAIIIARLPLKNPQNNKNIAISDESKNRFREWQSVAGTLIEEGLLSAAIADKCSAIIKETKSAENSDFESVPLGSKLYLIDSAAIRLAENEIFNEVCKHYQVYVDERIEKYLLDELHSHEQNQETISWLREIQEYIKHSFEKDIYRGISDEKLINDQEFENETTENYRMRPAFELMLLSGDSESAAVIDDRWFSKYISINGRIPILTVYELLLTLKAHGHLDDRSYYEKLQQLRRENFRYLPVTKDEIIYSLDSSGQSLKSLEFSTLRKYLASCLLDNEYLEKPAPDARNFGEIQFVFACERSVIESIGHVWSESSSIEIATGKANAVLENLYIGYFGLSHFLPADLTTEAGALHLAADYTYFCVQAIGILANPAFPLQERIARTKAYFKWVNYIFKEHLRSNSAFIEKIAQYMVFFLANDSEYVPAEQEDESIKEMAQKNIKTLEMLLINNLPDGLRQRILDNEDIKRKFDFTPENIYAAGEMQFRGGEIWGGVERALSGEQVSVDSRNKDQKVDIEKVSDDKNPSVTLRSEDGLNVILDETVIGVLLPDNKQRYDFIVSNRNLFDRSEEEILAEAENFKNIDDPEKRVDAFHEWTKNDAAMAYRNIEREVNLRDSFSGKQVTDFPLAGLLKHFRLPDKIQSAERFGQVYESSLKQLLNEKDIEFALNLAACFPSQIPEFLLEEFNQVPPEQKKSLLENFRIKWRSPVSKLHYIFLAVRLFPEDTEILENAKHEAQMLFEKSENLQFEIFNSLLLLVCEQFARTPDVSELALSVRLSLIWAHSSRLYNIISVLAADAQKQKNLIDYLNSFRPFWSRGTFNYDPDFWNDNLHPRFLERESFLGLAAGALFAGLPEELLNKIDLPDLLLELCFFDSDDRKLPFPLFWKDFGNRFNSADSFLEERSFALFNLLFASKNEVMLFPQESLRDYLKLLIDQICQLPEDDAAWFHLSHMTSNFAGKSILSGKFFKVIEKLDFQSIIEKDINLAFTVLLFLVKNKEKFSENAEEQFRNWLHLIVLDSSKKYPEKIHNDNKQLLEDILNDIIEAAIWLTVKPFDPIASSRGWNEILFQLGEMWPNFHVNIESILFRLWFELPADHIQGIGKNLLYAKTVR